MRKALLAALVALSASTTIDAAPLTSAFTYQGRLEDAGQPANGLFDFTFAVYDTDLGGAQVAAPLVVEDLPVENGVFTVQLDFGAAAFAGEQRWIAIGVRPGDGTGAYDVLEPRQPVTPSPYAITALSVRAIDASQVTSGNLAPARLPTGGVWGISSPLEIERSPPIAGSGALLFVADKGALRAGRVTGTDWDDPNVGSESFAAGLDTRAFGQASIAMGSDATAGGVASVAIGEAVLASGRTAFALGDTVTASGRGSVALGTRASTNFREGAFVFGDRSDTEPPVVLSGVANSASWRVNGGFRIYTSGNLSTGVTFQNGSQTSNWGQSNVVISTSTGASLSTTGVWTNSSDVNRKRDFSPVDGEQVLATLRDLPVTSWSYRNDQPGVRHIGPTAQDFRAAFGLGHDDKAIGTVDADGVALAAAKALEARSAEQREKIESLERENEALRERLEKLERAIGTR